MSGKKDIFVYAGWLSNELIETIQLGNFRPDKDLEEYSLNELVWDRTNYEEL